MRAVKLHPKKTDSDFGWYIYGSCLQQIKGESHASSNPFLRIYFFLVLFGAFWFQGQVGIGKAEEVDWSSLQYLLLLVMKGVINGKLVTHNL